MNNPVSQLGIPYIGTRNCETSASLAVFADKLYNVTVSTTSKRREVFLFPSVKGGLVRKVALRYWKWKQPSRPFWLEIKR